VLYANNLPRMNWEAIGAIGEIVGAVAVVFTLIYLSTQIRQNNKLLSSDSRQTLVANDLTSLLANVEHSEVFAKLVLKEELSAEEQLKLSFIFAIDLRNREFEYFQYVNGLLDEATWQSYRKVVLINHSSELGRKWWNEIGRDIVDPEFAKQIDELLDAAEPDTTYIKMTKWANK
jgi:hypothetical protein